MVVVILFTLGHAAGCWVAGVVESFAVRQPRKRAIARAVDNVCELAAGGYIADVKCGLLAPVLERFPATGTGRQPRRHGFGPPPPPTWLVGTPMLSVWPRPRGIPIPDRLLLSPARLT